MNKIRQPVILCILDGWGHRTESDSNAIAQASTVTYDDIIRQNPNGLLSTSAEEVGLPRGQMGNSEVGHMNIGAGRIVLQDLVRIDKAISTGELEQTSALRESLEKLRSNKKRCHLIGMVSPGGVHSHQYHIEVLAKIIGKYDVKTNLHAILDGRDTPPLSALKYLDELKGRLSKNVTIATISGRYYAMDRDKRWDRTSLYYKALCHAEGPVFATDYEIVNSSYEGGISDEFVIPSIVGKYQGINDGDSLIMANFRADRVRQILSALVDPEFDSFHRKRPPNFSVKNGLISYSKKLDFFLQTFFPP